jgi:hypothetical protein
MTEFTSGAASKIAARWSGATTSAALDFDEQPPTINRIAAAATASRQGAHEDTGLQTSS